MSNAHRERYNFPFSTRYHKKTLFSVLDQGIDKNFLHSSAESFQIILDNGSITSLVLIYPIF